MKLTNLKSAETYDIKNLLRKNSYLTSLSEYQLSKIVEVIDERYSIYEWDQNKEKTSLGWRLTVPFLTLLFLLSFFIFCPLKWLITGEFYLSQKSKYKDFLVKWNKKAKTSLI